jgi:hypothetical protein
MIRFLNCLRLGLFSSLFSSFCMPLSTPLILLLSLILLLLSVLLLTNLLGIEVAFLILLVELSTVVARVLIILFKLRTATRGLILGRSACFGSLFTPGDTARVLFTIRGDAPLLVGVVPRLDNIPVKGWFRVKPSAFSKIYNWDGQTYCPRTDCFGLI